MTETPDKEEAEVLSSIIRSQRILLRGLVRSVRKGDITLQQAAVLRILVQNGPTSMNRLSKELMVTPPNVTGIVDRLEQKGLVKRVSSQKDRRATDIKLTAKGEKFQRRVRRDYRVSLGASLAALTGEEQKTLAALLERLAQAASTASK